MKRECFIFIFIIVISSLLMVNYSDVRNTEKDGGRSNDVTDIYDEVLENMTVYGYKYQADVGSDKYPQNTHLCVEKSDGSAIYFVDSADNTVILKLNTTTGVISTIRDISSPYKGMWYDRANEIIYITAGTNDGLYASRIEKIDLSNDVVTSLYVGTGYGSYDKVFDCIYASSLPKAFYHTVLRGGSGPNYDVTFSMTDASGDDSTQATGDIWTGKTFDISFGVIISGFYWFLYYHEDGNVELWKHELAILGGGTYTSIHDCGAGTSLPSSKQLQGIAYDGSDILYFVLDVSGTSYLYSYSIGTDTLTQKGEYNVALMLDRNTYTSNPIPFNLEKAFGLSTDANGNVNTLFVYQISATKGHLYKIADLNNLTVSGTTNYLDGYIIVAITDTYLFVRKTATGAVELWKFQSMDSAVVSAKISHGERNYPTANLEYDSGQLNLTEGMHLQFIGKVTTATVTTTLAVRFEGYVRLPKDSRIDNPQIKKCSLVNDLGDDLKLTYSGTQAAGRTDEHMSAIITAQCNYGTNGTHANGGALSETVYKGGIELKLLFNELKSFDKFTWYSTPTGVINSNNGAVDSGVNYADNASLKIYDVKLFKRDKIYNEIHIEGAYVDGVLIESSTDGLNQASQYEFGLQSKTFLIPILNTIALCNTDAQALCDLLSESITIVNFTVLDTTNGMIQVGEEITLTLANNTYRTISAAQYKINKVEFNDRTGLATYTVSSAVYYSELEFGRASQSNTENTGQLGDTIVGNSSDIATNASNISTNASNLTTHEALTTTAHGGIPPAPAHGTYAGNNGADRQITGLGFDPTILSLLYIYSGTWYMTWVTADMAVWSDITPNAGGAGTTNRIKLITDGFQLNNGGADALYNTTGNTYYWMAWGG